MSQLSTLFNKDYISTKEASQRYNYSLKTIRWWIKTRKVKAFKHARKWYVHEGSLEAWVNHL